MAPGVVALVGSFRGLVPVLLLVLSCGRPSGAERAPKSAQPPATRERLQVAITVDDLPVHGPAFAGIDREAIADRLLAAFAAHRVAPVHGFVNGKRVDDDPRTEVILRRWLAAGHPLGNHTWSHPSLNRTALPEYLADIERGDVILRKLGAHREWRPFRYPFLFEGDTIEKRDRVRAFLRGRGDTAAPVSIDGNDWAFNPPYGRCLELGDHARATQLITEFVDVHVAELRNMRKLTRALVGRDIRHILLLHIGAADAAAIDALLTAYEREGVQWVDLPTALADPFYSLDTRPYSFGAAAPYRVAKDGGVPAPPATFTPESEQRLEATCRRGGAWGGAPNWRLKAAVKALMVA
jgi:peptidoglycan/xylan/chitin deacetylase (PgdA/CDA1 family)